MDKYQALADRVAKLEARCKQMQALLDRVFEDIEAQANEPAEAESGVSLDNLLRRLTDKQAAILSGVLENLSSQEIAELTNVTANTVRTHLRYIYRKAEVSQRHQLITKYQEAWESMSDETFDRLTGGKAERLKFELHQ